MYDKKVFSWLVAGIATLGLSLFVTACGGTNSSLAEAPCGQRGEQASVNDTIVCIYNPITETRFRCPADLPYRTVYDTGLVVCSANEVPGSELEDELVARGYNPNPTERPDDREPPNDDPPVNNDQETNDDTNIVTNMCEPGQTNTCTCVEGVPGQRACEDGQWGQCDCVAWDLPGHDEAEPFDDTPGCTEGPMFTELPANADNTDVAPGACLTEVFERNCPIMRTRATFEGDQQTWERRDILNQPVFEESIHHWYHAETPYEANWMDGERDGEVVQLFDNLIDGVVDRTTLWSYDQQDRLTFQSVETDGYVSTDMYVYDDEDRIIETVSRLVTDDTDNTYRTTVLYNDAGDLVEHVTRQNGIVTAFSRWTYGDDGLPLRHEQLEFGGFRNETDYLYHESGGLARESTVEYGVSVDEDGTEWNYVRELVDVYYDERGNEIARTIDNGGNGLRILLYEQRWSDDNRLLESSYGYQEEDEPERLTEYFYRPDGSRIRTETTEFRPGQEFDRITTTLHDELGNATVTTEIIEATGELLSASYNTWQGALQLTRENDSDGDGVIDTRSAWDYDAAGNLLDAKFDHDADGQLEERTVYRYDCD